VDDPNLTREQADALLTASNRDVNAAVQLYYDQQKSEVIPVEDHEFASS
jgi:hypothetical protein